MDEVAEGFERIGNTASASFTKVRSESESLGVSLRGMAREVASVGASAVAVGKLGEQFGVLNKQQADTLVTMGSMVSLSGTVARGLSYLADSSLAVATMEKLRGAAHAFADAMSSGAMKIASTLVNALRALAASSWAVAIAEKARAVASAIAAAVSSLGVAVPVIIAAAAAVTAGVLAATGQIPGLAEGAVVTAPTVALIGERGPEAVVPLSEFKLDERVAMLEMTTELHRKFIHELSDATYDLSLVVEALFPLSFGVVKEEIGSRFIGVREATSQTVNIYVQNPSFRSRGDFQAEIQALRRGVE